MFNDESRIRSCKMKSRCRSQRLHGTRSVISTSSASSNGRVQEVMYAKLAHSKHARSLVLEEQL